MTRFLRKILLLLLSFAFVAVVLLFYYWFAGPEETGDSQPEQNGPSAPIDLTDIKRIGSTDSNLESAKKLEYYQRGPGGRVERVYRAEQFQLTSDDQAALEEVTFIWHLKNSQTLTLTSDSGQVHLDRGANRMQPTWGRLSGNVQIVFRFPNTSAGGRYPVQSSTAELAITTDELDFDMRTCRLWTDRAVQLRGTDLDANGTGFLLRWREVSQEIDRLAVREGGELTWRGGQAGAFGNLIEEPANTTDVATGEGTTDTSVDPEGIRSYTATFDEDVRITYNDRHQVQTVRNVDRLNILFDLVLSSQSGGSEKVQTEPSLTTNGKTPVTQTNDLYRSSTLRLTWKGPLTVVPVEPELEQAATVRRLRLEAIGVPVTFNTRDVSGSCATLEAEQDTGIVRLIGTDDDLVHLKLSDGTDIETKELIIDPPAKDARQVRMLGKGNLKTTGQAGQSRSSISEQPEAVDLSWQESALLQLARQKQSREDRNSQTDVPVIQTSGKDGFYLTGVTARGRVVALSQQFTTRANMVHIELEQPGSDGTDKGQAIRVLRAEDEFSAELLSETGKLITIKADEMETTFSRCSSGKGQYASSIDLMGSVWASEQVPDKHSQSELQCREMLIALVENKVATSEKSNSYIRSEVSGIAAQGDVIGRYSVKGQDRSSLEADKLVADKLSATTTLYGHPAKLKRSNNDQLSSGKIIITKLGKDDEQNKNYALSAPAPGQISMTFRTVDEAAPPALFDLAWTDSLIFDSQNNKAVFRSVDSEKVAGTILHDPTSSSKFATDKLELYLQDKEETLVTDRTVLTEDMISSETFFQPMGDKTLRKMVMTGQAEVRNIKHPIDKPDVRICAALLRSDVLTYEVFNNRKENKSQFYGEGPGSLLLEDYRSTDNKVTSERAGPIREIERSRRQSGPVLQRVGPGRTAFVWKKSARYYQDERTAVLAGDVHMVSMGYALTIPGRSSRATDPAQQELHKTDLWCEKFTVTFTEPEAQKIQDGKSGFADISAMDEVAVEMVEAAQDASLMSRNISVEGAEKILYNKKAGEIIIEGSRKSRATVVYFDPATRQWVEWTGKSARYLVATGELKAEGGNSRVLY